MPKKSGVPAVAIALALFAGSAALAQSVISAHSGLIHYVEGDVYVADKPVELKYSVFPEVREGQVLRTGEEGRAEMLLSPGTFLRLAEASSVRMVSNKLNDTRVEVLGGNVLLEAAEMLADNAVTLQYKDQSIAIRKNGLYRVDAEHGTFRVYNGEAVLTRNGETFTVKQARSVELDAPILTASKFDNKVGDEFFRWASRRASYLSMANVASAKQLYDSGATLTSSRWAWNPWYGMFTYMPYRGAYMSPFGYGFWSPYQVVGVIYPNYNNGYTGGGGYGGMNPGGTHYDSGLGYNVGSRSASSGSYSSGSMGSSVSSPAASAPASSPASRGGDSGGSRGASSGGGRGH
jgi:hypothetical protein